MEKLDKIEHLENYRPPLLFHALFRRNVPPKSCYIYHVWVNEGHSDCLRFFPRNGFSKEKSETRNALVEWDKTAAYKKPSRVPIPPLDCPGERIPEHLDRPIFLTGMLCEIQTPCRGGDCKGFGKIKKTKMAQSVNAFWPRPSFL